MLMLCPVHREAEPRTRSPPKPTASFPSQMASPHGQGNCTPSLQSCAGWAKLSWAPSWVLLATPTCLLWPKSTEPQGSIHFPPSPCSPPVAAIPRGWLGQPVCGVSPYTCFSIRHLAPAPSAQPRHSVLQYCPHLGLSAQALTRASLPALGPDSPHSGTTGRLKHPSPGGCC